MVSSSLRSRRSSSRQAAPTQQILVFRLRQDWFALPIQVVHKVIPLDALYGSTPNSASGLVLYNHQEIPVIDVEQRIYGVSHRLTAGAGEPNSRRYLLIVQNMQGEFVGLPIDEQPALERVPESAFSPLSSTYLTEGTIRCVSALVVSNQAHPPLFLINLNLLMQSQATLPAGAHYGY